ncbi:unnamed protein product [Brachionus calyciflorus]|uniref:Olfactomedin-like domain-containing protein n=1 Tax=Brachionus calyciflorus TaxID=104777 RepID=A0A814GM99_9BILA|nr:unnamed protein product [Brachionus calyciflorus]
MCQSLDELKSYRCYRHLSLEYSYYGTGHTIYKGYLFYNQEGTNELVIHRLDGKETKKVVISNDSLCCDQHLNMYNIKHSGYYDFEIDENGLWLIYRDNAENYVILKIDDNNFKELKILKRWTIKIKRENISNMFISCGKLYALGDTSKNPATIYKICDLFNDFECSNSYEKENFALSISSRQVTSLKYDSSQKILYSVDGGSLMYYKFQV